MAEYRLLTIWRIRAPLESVFATIQDALRWPGWWPGVLHVEPHAAGNAAGIGSIWHCAWQGQLPYRLTFEVTTTRIEPLLAIEGNVRGDLEGSGRWHFSRQGEITIARCEWQVRSTRWWMNLLAPLARPFFIRNHARVMAQGGMGLARRLAAELVSQETTDLMAAPAPAPIAAGPSRERGRIDPVMVVSAGIVAGVLATLVQLALWWLAAVPLPETLYRDARLTAALLMGPAVLPPPATAQWDILLVATLIHFALSIAYAVIPAWLARRLERGTAWLAGALYGLLIYGINLYGLTHFFPWFAVARDGITLVAHLVFGIALVEVCRVTSSNNLR